MCVHEDIDRSKQIIKTNVHSHLQKMAKSQRFNFQSFLIRTSTTKSIPSLKVTKNKYKWEILTHKDITLKSISKSKKEQLWISITQHSNHISLLQKAHKNDLTSTVEEKIRKCHSTTETKPPLVSTNILKWLRIKACYPLHRVVPSCSEQPYDKNSPQDFLQQPESSNTSLNLLAKR